MCYSPREQGRDGRLKSQVLFDHFAQVRQLGSMLEHYYDVTGTSYIFHVLVLDWLTLQDTIDLFNKLVLHVQVLCQMVEQPCQRCRCCLVTGTEHNQCIT